MTGRRTPSSWRRAARLGVVLMLLGTGGVAAAQQTYNYSGAGLGSGESAFLLVLEGILINPRNADNVVAVVDSGPNSTYRTIIPVWDDDLAGRLGLGYRWGNGAKIMGTLWQYSTSVRASQSGIFQFPIGPAIGAGEGDIGTGYDIDTEITAGTADLAFGFGHELSESFVLDWSVGLRFADFEETASGTYVNGTRTYEPSKSNEGQMVGARAAVRGTYRWKRFSLAGGVGVSFLDGELTASSGLTEVGGTGRSSAEFQDDGRSGNIFDIDVAVAWHDPSDTVSVLLGWEQQVWEGISADMMRNLPGTLPNLSDRDSITFSGLKLGVHLVF